MSDKATPSTNGTTSRSRSISLPSDAGNALVPFLAVISIISIIIFIPIFIPPSPKTEPLPSKPVTAPTQAPSLESPYEKQYTVRVKECKDKKEADQVISLLHQQALPALERRLSNGNRLISSGKFFKKKDADDRLAILKSKGFSDSMVLEPTK